MKMKCYVSKFEKYSQCLQKVHTNKYYYWKQGKVNNSNLKLNLKQERRNLNPKQAERRTLSIRIGFNIIENRKTIINKFKRLFLEKIYELDKYQKTVIK